MTGHCPTWSVLCKFCADRGEWTRMFLRYSLIILGRSEALCMSEPVNQIAFKCPECAWVTRFNVTDDTEYLKEIVERRKGRLLYLPPVEEWGKENEEIARQLASLGYVGGR